MKETVKDLRKKLLLQVRKMRKNPAAYASRSGRDLTHRRTLTFEKVVLILLTMSCESQGKSLMKSSVFKKELSFKALEVLFHSFTDSLFPEKKYRGYCLLAADGMSLKSSAYPADPLSYLPGTDRRHGWK